MMYPTLLLLALTMLAPSGETVDPDVVGLRSVLEEFRSEAEVPDLAVAIVSEEGGILAAEAVGVAQRGAEEAIAPRHAFKYNSLTKAMTATMIAGLVEDGTLGWDQTLGEVFPVRSARSPYSDVTLHQLLSHTSGVVGVMQEMDHGSELSRYLAELKAGDPGEQRLAVMEHALTYEPLAPPGSEKNYSNIGYVMAAAMVEKVTGIEFETLLRSRLFEAAEIEGVWIGRWPPQYVSPIPPLVLGHNPRSGEPVAFDDRDWYPTPAAMSPAGASTYGTISGLGAFLRLHLRGLAGRSSLLEAETFRFLHTPALEGEMYAMGWNVVLSEIGPVHDHSGSDGTYFSYMALFPKDGLGIALLASSRLMPGDVRKLLDTLRNDFAPKE